MVTMSGVYRIGVSRGKMICECPWGALKMMMMMMSIVIVVARQPGARPVRAAPDGRGEKNYMPMPVVVAPWWHRAQAMPHRDLRSCVDDAREFSILLSLFIHVNFRTRLGTGAIFLQHTDVEVA